MTTNIHNLLPRLTVNEIFIRDLMSEKSPCFALGYVEEYQSIGGFLVLRPDRAIPTSSTQQGFRFGHSVIGTIENPVFHFIFEFYGYATYHGLVDLGNPLIKKVISTMIEKGDYFFFAINPDQTVTAFRSQLDTSALDELKTIFEQYGQTSESPEYYEKMCSEFRKKPVPPGRVFNWVCRNNPSYLDLTENRLELSPRQ
ncbi:MAG: hypothetical protein HRT37_00105 [Alteromonadaceae bacterium]|nr:hypothetical protein [Alteromonadaceae bacterium]